MATIDLRTLEPLQVEAATREEVEAALDVACRDLLGLTGDEFRTALREGREFDHPAAFRLGVLGRALNDTE